MVSRAASLVFFALAAPAVAAPRLGTGTEFPVASGPGDQLEPVVRGTTVAYTDRATHPPHIFIWSQATQSSTAITGGSGSQVTPSLSLDRLVYTDSAFDGDVRAFGLASLSFATLDPFPAAQTHPTVSARLAAWEDARNGDLRIRVHDFVQGGGSFDITGPGTYRLPRADLGLVVYIDDTAGGAVKVWQATSGASIIFAGPSASADVDALAGVVALSQPASGGTDIAVYDTGGTNRALLQVAGEQRNPRVSGDWVAFEDLATGVSRVMLWNWRTNDLLIPVIGSSEQQLGSLDWPRVVYADRRSGDFDVFLYDDSVTPPPPTDGGSDGGGDGGMDGGAGDGGLDGGFGGCRDDDCCDDDDDEDADDCDCEHHRHRHHGEQHHRRSHGDHCRRLIKHHHRCDHHDAREEKLGAPRSVCDDPDLRTLVELQVPGDLGPGADSAGFESPRDGAAVICIDVERVQSAWVEVNRRVVATPNDFDPNVVRVEARCRIRAGWNRLGGIVAGERGSWLRVRVGDHGRAADGEGQDGTGLDGGLGSPNGQDPFSAPGCASSGAGLALPLLVLMALPLLAGRRRR